MNKQTTTKKKKNIGGKEVTIYQKQNSRKEYVLYKKSYIPITEYRKIVAKNTNKNKNKKIKGGNLDELLNFINLLYKSDVLFPQNIGCFTNGTFIFEDNNFDLFKFLKRFNPKPVQFKNTHKTIRNTNIFRCSQDFKSFPDQKCSNHDIYQYEIEIPQTTIECENDKISKGVALIYHFETNGNMHYVFFKLEGYKAISTAHMMSAINRYLLKKETHKLSHSNIKRREDCFKDKNGCILKDKFINNQLLDEHIKNAMEYSSYDIRKGIMDSISFYDQNVRTGDEFFVPQYFTELLLNKNNDVMSVQPEQYE